MTTTIGLIRDVSHVLMEGVPRNIHYHELRKDLKNIDGVCNVHSLHVWSLTMDRNAIAVHLAVGKSFAYLKCISHSIHNGKLLV